MRRAVDPAAAYQVEGFGRHRRIKNRIGKQRSLGCHKELNMRLQHRILLLAATAITGLFVTQAQAQYRAVGDDGIAASPKVRQMLDQHGWSASTPFTAAAASGGQASGCKATTAPTNPCGQCCQHMSKQSLPRPAK
jgi:hypothetical protein